VVIDLFSRQMVGWSLREDIGVDAIWVSNHGGRQLDGAAAAVNSMRTVVDAVNGAQRS
jgi:isopentenyl diphosphate isomerase/L-lactate dehydrogenase-like FMN-dependent dehydrogenase